MWPAMRHPSMGLLLVLALGAIGCGASEQQHVQAALRARDRAVESEDPAAICGSMTGAAQRQWQAIMRASSCVEAYERIYGLAAEATPQPIDDGEALLVSVSIPERTEPGHVRVDGSRAVVYVGTAVDERLRKVDGRWLIDAS